MTRIRLQRLDAELQAVDDAYVYAQFNPTELTYEKSATYGEVNIPGLDSPLLQYVRGNVETLTFDLFFDTTELGMGEGATPVTTLTDKVYGLVRMNPNSGTPPVVLFTWGEKGVPGRYLDPDLARHIRNDAFQGVVERVQQKFSLFSPEGVPLRATLSLTVKEYRSLAFQVRDDFDDFIELLLRDVDASVAAAQLLNDPTRWREIADDDTLVENIIETAVGALAAAAVVTLNVTPKSS